MFTLKDRSMPQPSDIARIDRPAMAPAPTVGCAVQALDPLAVSDWDAQVTALAGSSFFHSAAWARVLEESYGFKPVYFAKTQGSRICAVLPMMEVKSWLTGKRGVSLPFTDSCEPLGTATDALVEAAKVHGRAHGWKYCEFRGLAGGASAGVVKNPELIPHPSSLNLPPSSFSSYYGHTLDLGPDEEKVFGKFDSSVRRAIRKAEKSGVTVEILRTIDAMREFYALHCLTRKKHGVPPQPFRFFEGFHRHVIAHNLGFVAVARFEGKPIAASVFVHLGAKAIYKYGASDENSQHLRGANVVMWRAIQWYARAGYTELDFGRTDPSNEGLRRYKLGWGAAEKTLAYQRYDFRANAFVAGQEKPPGACFSIFQRLPLPISRLIGAALYRHVA